MRRKAGRRTICLQARAAASRLLPIARMVPSDEVSRKIWLSILTVPETSGAILTQGWSSFLVVVDAPNLFAKWWQMRIGFGGGLLD
jgi:hypothetical protein